MELLARYLHAVRSYLPRAQQDDIIAELSDSIQSRMEEKEAELGRALTPDEEADTLRPYGPPIVAASRYWRQQYLIGPTLLPFYFRTLVITLAAMLAVNIGIVSITAIAKADALGAFVDFWGTIWGTIFVAGGIVTLVFALLERYQPKDLAAKWNPRALPPVLERRVSRVQSGVELAINGAAAIWLLGTSPVRHFVEGTALGPGIQYIVGLPFGIPWMHRFLEALFVVAAIHAILAAITLIRSDWFKLRAVVMTGTSAIMLIVTGSILVGGTPVTLGVGPSRVENAPQVVQILHWIAASSMLGICVGSAITIAVCIRQLLPGRSRRSLNLGLYGGMRS